MKKGRELTSLCLHVDRFVSLDEDGHRTLREMKLRFIHESRSPHQSVIIPFHTESVIPRCTCSGNLKTKALVYYHSFAFLASQTRELYKLLSPFKTLSMKDLSIMGSAQF